MSQVQNMKIDMLHYVLFNNFVVAVEYYIHTWEFMLTCCENSLPRVCMTIARRTKAPERLLNVRTQN